MRTIREDVLENRDLRDILDRVMDKGIVLDPAVRIGMQTRDHLGADQIVVGTIDTALDKGAA